MANLTTLTVRPRDDKCFEWLKIGASFVTLFAAAILPRLSLILAGVAYADDWGHPYTAHLQSYRPLAAFELWFWQTVSGTDYLTTTWPRFLSAIWYSAALVMMLVWLRTLGVPYLMALSLGVSIILHPAFNELILWGVLSSLAFATAFCFAGILLAFRGSKVSLRVAGLALVCLAATGSQLLASVGAICVLIETAGRGFGAVIVEPNEERWLRAALIILPPIVSVGVLMYMRLALGFEDFASRSLGVPEDFLQAKFHVVSNAYANTFQAPLGQVFGSSFAMGAFWPALTLPWIALLLLLRWQGVQPAKAALLAVLPPISFALALGPLMGTTATPTGFRIMGTALLMTFMSAALVSGPLWRSAKPRAVTVILTAIVGSANLAATLEDISIRTTAWERDGLWLADARSRVYALGAPQLQLCAWRFTSNNARQDYTRNILVSYNAVSIDQYSIWYSQFLANYLRMNGVNAESPQQDKPALGCERSCVGDHKITVGPLLGSQPFAKSDLYLCPSLREHGRIHE